MISFSSSHLRLEPQQNFFLWLQPSMNQLPMGMEPLEPQKAWKPTHQAIRVTLRQTWLAGTSPRFLAEKIITWLCQSAIHFPPKMASLQGTPPKKLQFLKGKPFSKPLDFETYEATWTWLTDLSVVVFSFSATAQHWILSTTDHWPPPFGRSSQGKEWFKPLLASSKQPGYAKIAIF